MAGYEDTKKKIVDTLTGRPAGHEIQPSEHEQFAIALLEYIRSVEVNSNSMFVGSAESSTTPIQPPTASTTYIGTVSGGETVTYTKFKDVEGNSITVTAEVGEAKIVVLIWNKQYWSAQEISITASITELGGYTFRGIATPSTIPVTNIAYAYLASTPGTYTNFGNLTVSDGEICLFTFDNTTDSIPVKTIVMNVESRISEHNESATAHSDIRNTIEEVDNNLQQQIDAITSSTDVRDVVGTYAELQAYDTSVLFDNDVVKVLVDENKNNAISYYRWVITEGVGAWSYVGSQGPFYTKTESDSKYATKNELQTGLSTKADDTNTLHKTGAETASGVKTFSDGIKIASVGVQYDATNECLKFVFN